MEDEFIPIENIPKRQVGTRWVSRFDRMQKTGQALLLYPKDKHQAHTLRSTARGTAKAQGLSVRTAVRIEDGVLKLYVALT